MPLIHEQRGPVAVLTLSRPDKRNAWGTDYHDALKTLMPKLEQDRDTRCVVLTGDEAGGAFCAGADMKNESTHTLEGIGEFLGTLRPSRRVAAFTLLSDFPKPII